MTMNPVYLGNHRILITPAWGGKMIVPSDDLTVSLGLILDGCHEVSLTKFLIGNVKKGQTVVDAGAHVGYFSILLGTLILPDGRLIAYEPNPHLYPFLLDNLTLNGLRETVSARQKAVYAADARISLYMADKFQGNSSIHRHGASYLRTYANDTIVETAVDAEPLDVLLDSFPHIDLVKLDVEGGEYQAFLGMRRMLAREAVDTIVFEFNGGMLQDDWPPFSALLLDLYARRHAVFYTLADDGTLVDADIRELAAQGDCAAVVMRLPRGENMEVICNDIYSEHLVYKDA